MKKVLFVTSRDEKVKEANEYGKEHGIEFEKFTFDSPELRDDDVVEVAKDKAKKAFAVAGKPLIVEDAGMFIDALNGFPGTYSAWVYKKIGNAGLLKLLEGEENRKACMRACIVHYNGKDLSPFLGEVRGVVPKQEMGTEGFGFDPIFIPEGCEKTFAQDFGLKQKMSHRKRAVRKFCDWYSEL